MPDGSHALSQQTSPLYRALDITTNEVRFLELHPGSQDEEITCSLHYRRLDADACYEALSYVWGDQREKTPISIGSNVLNITMDLAAALRRLRYVQTPRLLWIDQVCINQDDLAERASQVNLMRNIYESAVRVIVWLGEEDDMSTKAMFFIHQHKDLLKHAAENTQLEVFHRFFNDPSNRAGLEAIVHAIMMKPYFERYWIIQEIVLANDAVVYRGSKSASWRTVMHFIGMIRYNPALVDAARKQRNDSSPQGMIWQRLDIFQQRRHLGHADLFEPWSFLLSFRYSKATVPSDRIYSWLGLCDQWRRSEFTIDYSRHCHHTYRLFTRAMIEHEHNLRWLSHAGSPRSFPTLPSWVPDLELPIGMKPDPLALQKNMYGADQGSKFCASFSQDSSILYCRGISIDRISFLTNGMNQLLDACIGGRLDRTDIPARLLEAAMSRYGNHLTSRLQDLYTAGRIDCGDESGALARTRDFTFIDILRHLKEAGGIPARKVGWLNAMYLLGESTIGHRKVFVSELGYVGLVPKYAAVGDAVCILFGSEVPVVLRNDGEFCRFVGDW